MPGKIDPRYDPVFQRGYRGGADASAGRAHESRPAAVPRPVVDSAPVPDAVPQASPARAGSVPPVSPVTVEVLGEGAGPVSRVRVPNPFIILLWVLGPSLLLISAWASNWAFSEQWGVYAMPRNMAQLQLITMMAQPATFAGFAIIGGLLFWHASSFRRRRE